MIHETIDGEVIVINLASGNYYSLKGSGADIWEVLQSSPGADVSTIAEAVARSYGRPGDALEGEIAEFVRRLKDEELVTRADSGDVSAIPPSNGGRSPEGGATTFDPPLLEKYTDMQDLVLLDPVHEVDATGWPQPKPDASQTP